MSTTFVKELEDLFIITINGTFTFDDQTEIENKPRQEIQRRGKVKLLVLAEDFSGWGKEGDWGDLTFFNEYGPYIEKIAVVAQGKWRGMCVFV